MCRISVLATLILVGTVLSPSASSATEEEERGDGQRRWIAVQDQVAIVLPDGETYTEQNPPPGEGFVPPVGSRVFVDETLYAAVDGNTRGDEVGRTHIECTAQVVRLSSRCDTAFVLTTGSQLHGVTLVDLSAQTGTEPLQLEIAVTGGTEEFFGATGEVSLLDITDPDDPAAEIMTLYETDIELARSSTGALPSMP
jgi:hypothetical protein